MSSLKPKTQVLRELSSDKHIKRMLLARSKLSRESLDSKYSSKCLKGSSINKFSENLQDVHTKIKSKPLKEKAAILQQSNKSPHTEKSKMIRDINKKKDQEKKPVFIIQKEIVGKNSFSNPRTPIQQETSKLSDIRKIRGKNISNKNEHSNKLEGGLKRDSYFKPDKKDVKTTKESNGTRNEKVNTHINQNCEATKGLNSSSKELTIKYHNIKNKPLNLNPKTCNRPMKASTKCVLTQRSRVEEKGLNCREKCIGDTANNDTNKGINQENHVLSEKDMMKKVYKYTDYNLLNYIHRNLSSGNLNCNGSDTTTKSKVLDIDSKKNNKVKKYSEWRKSLNRPIKDSSVLLTEKSEENKDLNDCNTNHNIKNIQLSIVYKSSDDESSMDNDHLSTDEIETKHHVKGTDHIRKPNIHTIKVASEHVEQDNIQLQTNEEDSSSENYSISSVTSDNCSIVSEVNSGEYKKETYATRFSDLEDHKSENYIQSKIGSSPDSRRKNIDRSQIWIQFAKAYAENSDIYRRKRQLHRSKIFDKPVLNLGMEINMASKDL